MKTKREMDIVIGKYKKWRKNRYEANLREFIKFNVKKIKEYESDVDIATITKNDPAICQNYDRNYLKKLQQKYGIDKILINEVNDTEDKALKKYYKKRESEISLRKSGQERKEIDLYKKTILELKQENKI